MIIVILMIIMIIIIIIIQIVVIVIVIIIVGREGARERGAVGDEVLAHGAAGLALKQ